MRMVSLSHMCNSFNSGFNLLRMALCLHGFNIVVQQVMFKFHSDVQDVVCRNMQIEYTG